MTDLERAELDRLRRIEADELKIPILRLAEGAWNAVRNRDDAPWDSLSVEMKGKLTALAEKYSGGAQVAEGDYPPEGFAEKVFELASSETASSATIAETAPTPVFGVPSVHEDTRIPSPNPEDVDPLKEDLAEPPKGKLPADFPGHDVLHEAGINTFGQAIKQQGSEEGLEGVEGVGPATAKKIKRALK